MHELSIAHSILSIAERSIPPETAGYASAVSLTIGELSGIETDALQFAFEALKDKTVLAKAVLDIEIIPGEAQCSDCSTVFHMPSFGTCCTACGSYLLHILKGKEMKVKSITMEE
jgi:hydrogenase nickel incorporation protein HypA/HybF